MQFFFRADVGSLRSTMYFTSRRSQLATVQGFRIVEIKSTWRQDVLDFT
jgi:hypothetical protein